MKGIQLVGYTFLFTILFILSGCVEHEYFDYDSVDKEMFGGNLIISVRGTALKAEKAAAKVYRGAPYYLDFTFRIDKSYNFVKLRVSNIVIIGNKTRGSVSLSDAESVRIAKFKNNNTSGVLLEANVSKRIPTNSSIIYEPLEVNATVQIYLDRNNFVEKRVSAIINTKHIKENHLKIFDKFMSV